MADVTTEKKDSKSKLLTAVVIVSLCVIFVVGFVYGLNSVLAMEGSFPPAKLTPSKTPLPDTVLSSEADIAAFTKEDMAAYLKTLTETALTNEAAASSERSYDIDGDTVTSDGSDKFNDTLKFLADDISDDGTDLGKAMFADFEKKSSDFGEDMSGFFRVPDITPEDIESFEIAYIYYVCPICGDTSETYLDHCEDCGSTYPYNEAYRDDYNIALHLINNESVLKRNFEPRTEDDVKALLADGAQGKFSLSKLVPEYKELTVSLSVDRSSDKLTALSYTKKTAVDLTADFEGEWEMLGTANISFELSQTDSFDLTWPGIELNEHELNLEPKGKDNLIATLTCSDPVHMNVEWTSSDKSIVDVDHEGYLTACKTDGGKAIITATYKFNGKSYSDSCEVTVKIPVESTSMKKNKITLSPGDEFALEVKFDPKDATFQTLTWFSEDESIAVVDANGVVKAVAPGEVTVYSLSDDGWFKSSCKVTVK